jgi:hypothetical protein
VFDEVPSLRFPNQGNRYNSHELMKLRSVADSLFTYLLNLKHDDQNYSLCSSMRIRTGYNADEIVIAVIEHEDKTNRSRPKDVLADLQLIERDGDTIFVFCC